MSESNVKGEITAKADIRATATVIRGAESWQFFAFIFAAVAAIGLSLIEELHVEAALAVGIKILYFFLCFYIFMANTWIRNRILMRLLGWIKTER